MLGAWQFRSWEDDAGSLQGFAFALCDPCREETSWECCSQGKENPVLLRAEPRPLHGSRDGNWWAAKPVAL